MNRQPIEKREPRVDATLDLHSLFPTFQGEGIFAGMKCVFVRLAGCNLQCPGCDTEYTEGRKRVSCAKILLQIQAHQEKGLVVITGGEPFRQDITLLLEMLLNAGYFVQIETNGTLPPPKMEYSINPWNRKGVYLVVSPKAGKVHPMFDKWAAAFKYVLNADSIDPTDGLPVLALQHSASPRVARPPLYRGGDSRFPCVVYLQPMDSGNPTKNKANLEAVKRSSMEHGYILQIQIHKVIGVQ